MIVSAYDFCPGSIFSQGNQGGKKGGNQGSIRDNDFPDLSDTYHCSHVKKRSHIS